MSNLIFTKHSQRLSNTPLKNKKKQYDASNICNDETKLDKNEVDFDDIHNGNKNFKVVNKTKNNRMDSLEKFALNNSSQEDLDKGISVQKIGESDAASNVLSKAFFETHNNHLMNSSNVKFSSSTLQNSNFIVVQTQASNPMSNSPTSSQNLSLSSSSTASCSHNKPPPLKIERRLFVPSLNHSFISSCDDFDDFKNIENVNDKEHSCEINGSFDGFYDTDREQRKIFEIEENGGETKEHCNNDEERDENRIHWKLCRRSSTCEVCSEDSCYLISKNEELTSDRDVLKSNSDLNGKVSEVADTLVSSNLQRASKGSGKNLNNFNKDENSDSNYSSIDKDSSNYDMNNNKSTFSVNTRQLNKNVISNTFIRNNYIIKHHVQSNEEFSHIKSEERNENGIHKLKDHEKNKNEICSDEKIRYKDLNNNNSKEKDKNICKKAQNEKVAKIRNVRVPRLPLRGFPTWVINILFQYYY